MSAEANSADPGGRQGPASALLATIVATTFALVQVLPAPAHRLAGGATVDAFGTWWFQWWAARMVHTRQSLVHTDLLFFPWGKDVLAHTGANVLDALLLAPLQPLLGAAGAWNLLAATILVSNGLAAALWGRGRGPVVIAAAAAFGVLAPFPLHELAMGRPTQALLAPLFLALWLGERGLREGGVRPLFAAGAALALQGWFYWYAAGFGALALIVLAAGRPLLARAGRLALVGAVSFALTAPVVVPLLAAVADGSVPGLLPVDTWMAGDAAYESVEGGAIRLGTLGAWGNAGFWGSRGWDPEGPTIGLVGLAALLFAPGAWRAVGLLGLLVALGPFPGGAPNPVYLGLTALLSPMERLYWPVRALSILIPAGVAGLVAGLSELAPSRRRLAAAAIGAALVVEGGIRGIAPLGTWSPEVPPVYACLAKAEGAVVMLPYGLDQAPLVYQTVHGKPMLNGMHERSPSLVPLEQQAFRRDNGWMHAVLRAPASPREDVPWTAEEKEAARALGYRFIVLRTGTLGGRLRGAKARLTALAGEPAYAADDVIVWAPWGGWPGCDATPAAP